MPTGTSFSHGYANGHMSYKKIAEFMTENGYKMGHSTAYGVHLSAMEKIYESINRTINDNQQQTPEEVSKIAADPRFQSAIEAYLREACTPK